MLSKANRRLTTARMLTVMGCVLVAISVAVVLQVALVSAGPLQPIFRSEFAAHDSVLKGPQQSDDRMSAEILAPTDGRSADELLEHFQQVFERAGVPLTGRITNNETVVSTENGRVSGNTITGKSFFVNLPEGSEMKARLFGENVRIQPGEKTGFVMDQGVLVVYGPDGRKRFTTSAVKGQLKIAASIASREVVFEVSAAGGTGTPTNVRVDIDIETGVKKYKDDAPHGHISYSLQNPGDDSEEPIRVKMHWVYEMDKLKAEAKSSQD